MSGPFSFLTATSRREELVAQHVLREHASGRDLHEILEDAYVRNRCTPEEIGRLLDRPELVHAIVSIQMLNAETIRLDGAIRMPPR